MSSVNKVILLGNLGADPEMRFTPGGQAVCNFRMATTDTWNDKSTGQKQERTEWHRVVVWGKLAELCGEYLKKGRQCYVEGSLQTREWQDKDGGKRFTTEVKASSIVFLGGRDQQQGQSRGGYDRPSANASGYVGNTDRGGPSYGSFDDDYGSGGGAPNDDIPFARRDF